MGKWEIGLGKQILRLGCPKGKLQFKFLSSTGLMYRRAGDVTAQQVACRQAPLVCYLCQYLVAELRFGSQQMKRASEKNGVRKSEPAQKPIES